MIMGMALLRILVVGDLCPMAFFIILTPFCLALFWGVREVRFILVFRLWTF
jgi:hypothetical protein